MIPKIIWQTYKTKLPPHISTKPIQSWLANAGYEWYYFDDERCEQFVKDHFTEDIVNMYTSLPLGVMKADFWRVAIVYVYGGIYADLDAVCIKSIDTWIKDEDLIISVETDGGSICNYAFAAKPKHPALLTCLHEFLLNYHGENYLNKIERCETPVQNYGAHAFSNGILKHYGLDNAEDMHKGGKSNHYNTINKVIEDKTKFLLFSDNEFSWHLTEKTLVHHQTASMSWGGDYDSWRKQQLNMFGV
jgi:mannosyltransferase OCH1-like enzyme